MKAAFLVLCCLLTACKGIPGLYCEEKVGDYFFVVYGSAKNEMQSSESMVFLLTMDSSLNQSSGGTWKQYPFGISNLQFFLRIEKRNALFRYEDYTSKDGLKSINDSGIIFGYNSEEKAFQIISTNRNVPKQLGVSLKLNPGNYRITLIDDIEIDTNAITESGICREYINCRYYLQRQTPLALSNSNQFLVDIQ